MGVKAIHFYSDEPVFGMDIGRSSIKVMQLDHSGKVPEILGYGTANFDLSAIDDGVIVRPEIIAEALHDLFEHKLEGEITTRHVALALPAYRTFTRAVRLPQLNAEELHEAVQLEVEQYVPMALEELYMDYTVTPEADGSQSAFVVAVPKKIVDSYLYLCSRLGIEPVLIEPTATAGVRFFARDQHSDIPSVLIDFGSLTATVCIIDKAIVAASTAPGGGLVFTEAIAKELGVDTAKAGEIKTKFGLDVSEYQKQIEHALGPSLEQIVTELKRMLRYYEEHYSGRRAIGQIVTLGGGANMPGLSDYLTNALKAPVRTHDHPWAVFKYDNVATVPEGPDRLMYATVAGLSLLDPKEMFQS